MRPGSTLTDLSPQEKRALLAKILKQQAKTSQLFPLSFAQERLWFIDQFEPNSPAYNVPLALRLRGELDVAALERTFIEIVNRHHVLRTTFTSVNGRPMQVIGATPELFLPLTNLSDRSESEKETDVSRLVAAEFQSPFDLSRGPLVRASLLRLAEREHILLLTMHHIVSDGWSSDLMVRELKLLYTAYSKGEPSPLPALSLQYADFAVWQREWLSGETLERQLSYWKSQLAATPAVLELPTKGPRPAVQSHNGAARRLTLSPELSDAIKKLSHAQSVTPFMTLLAAFQVLLYRYSGQLDIAVGTPVANRNNAEVESLIGFFVNTLVMRTQLTATMSFGELLANVRQTALDAYAHQDLPFEKIVEELQPERSLAHAPLFQVLFMFQRVSEGKLALPGLQWESVKSEIQTTRFDLELHLFQSANRFSGGLIYNTDLFDAGTIERMLGHFQTLLESATADPAQSISKLPLLSAAEHQQLLSDWNSTTSAFPGELCLHEQFELQAAKTPQAVAVRYQAEALTYQELNARANQLAHYLRRLGIGPEKLVGICMERSVEMLISVLGILKAGGAYVPLDSTYPAERLVFMVHDAGIKLLLTQQPLIDRIKSEELRIVCLDAERSAIDKESVENVTGEATPKNTAYVIYTSGSSGTPKGVVVRHRGVSNVIHTSIEKLQVSGDSRVLQLASLGFDASVLEVFMALLSGACLYLVPRDTVSAVFELAAFIDREEISTIASPPSLLDALPEGDYSSLQSIIVGGESCPPETCARWSPGRLFFNAYAPTEATIYSTLHECAGTYPYGPPIGQPIANTRVYILDAQQQLSPAGVIGELHIGGEGLARGYLNRAELTAEKFIPDAFGNSAGGRLYKTGDLARYQEDGNLEFAGRLDQQVKVRGYRIELGEIEVVLGSHGAVKDCVVIAREDEPRQKRLVGYVVSETAEPIKTEELRSYLKERLPDYMVPSAFVTLDTLPLTTHGKVDRKNLPAPELQRLAGSYQEPGTPVEQLLAVIWSQILGVNQIGLYDNFFELGGHSLLAARLVSRMREAFKVEVSLRSIFEEPQLAGQAAGVEALLREEVAEVLPLKRATRDQGRIVLSFAQERLWFLDQLLPNSSAYNLTAVMRLRGELKANALEQSFAEVIRRHEALRTTFEIVDGGPVQVISTASFQLAERDLSAIPEPERMAAVRRLANEESERPFDLQRGPLLRAGLLRLAAGDHVLLLTMHHIIGDAWSMGVLMRELRTFYDGYAKGESPSLPELPVQYADYAIWQREWLSGEELAKQLAYWQNQLNGAPTVLELPADRPRPALESHRGGSKSFLFSATLLDGLAQLSRHEGATLFMTLLAAFQTLLYRYTGQEDIVVGTPIANRNRAEVEGLIGFFVNTLVMRARVRPQMTFRTLLANTRETSLQAYTHQDVSFEKLVEELQPERNLSHQPLFQVLFVLQNASREEFRLHELEIESLGTRSRAAKFDLTLFVGETPRGLAGSIEYNTDLFDPGTIERMCGHFETLLHGIVENDRQRLSQLPLLTKAECEQLEEWNQTDFEYPQTHCVHEVVEAQAEKTPDAPAIIFDDQQITYRELNERANQLAHYLVSMDVGPESRVGICLERSFAMLTAVLGVLKAGGAYVSLDPSYPAERLRFMMQDADISILLTERQLQERFGAHDCRMVLLDADQHSFDRESTANVSSGVTPDNLVYVIFTSGSTGRPKGVMMSHRALANLLSWQVETYPNEAAARTLQFTSLSFDVSFQEIFSTWWSGGALILITDELRRDPAALLELIVEQEITRLFMPFAALQNLAEAAASSSLLPTRLQQFITAGEQLQIGGQVADFFGRLPNCSLHNHYGPSEAHVVTSFDLEGHPENWPMLPPIGRPIRNSRIHLLDAQLNPVPIGVSGELHIGGVAVSRGYLNGPDRTAERFIPDPFASVAGQLLYKTGDLARYRPDGNIEFLGRLDHQVKLRGYRVELGEIEALLRAYPGVLDDVVMVREDSGDKRLVAYLVSEGEAVKINELRSYLREKLPEYMIPSAFVELDALPLNPNGKVDRKALPAPEILGDIDRHEPARTPVEEVLVGIWSEVLQAGCVGIHDNFFELGGHSLLATRLISRVKAVFEIEVALRSIFESPTIAGLADVVETALRGGSEKVLPLRGSERDRSGSPLSHAQERLWFLNQLEPESVAYNMALAMRLRGELNVAVFNKSLSELVRRHEVLRTTFVLNEGVPVQMIAPAVEYPIPVVDLSEMSEADRESKARKLAHEEAHRPFDLAHGPILRASLLRLAPKDHVLLLTVHHIACDGWSIGIFFRELSVLYEAFGSGNSSPLVELSIQYADFANWQRQYLSGGVLEAQLAYWRKQLEGAPSVIELPTDWPRPALQSNEGAIETFALSNELTEQLKDLSRRENVTLFMTLLATFQTLLHRYSGQSQIVVGTDIANRNRVETEGLIGFFVNELPLRADFAGDPIFRELLQQVREISLGAYAHQDLAFGRLVEDLQPERTLSYNPLFQVLFTLQNVPRSLPKFAGLELSRLESAEKTAKFDLSLSIVDSKSELLGVLEYSTDLFDQSTIKRLAQQFELLLRGVVRDPQRRVSELELMSEAERQQVLGQWNETAAAYPQGSYAELFAQQVERRPEAVAVSDGAEKLTYAELSERAEQLAQRLGAVGVGAETVVGLIAW